MEAPYMKSDRLYIPPLEAEMARPDAILSPRLIGLARPVVALGTDNAEDHDVAIWAATTATQLISIRPDTPRYEDCVAFRDDVATILFDAFKRMPAMRPDQPDNQTLPIARDAWGKILKVASGSPWEFWFSQPVTREQMLPVIRRNLLSSGQNRGQH